jgi:two-component system CheB/CheR fusion protein
MVTRNPGAGVDLAFMVAEELLAYAAKEGEQVTIDGPEVRLQPKAAETMALAVHELVTNAVKYGALASPAGRLHVSWTVGDGAQPQLIFDWLESRVKVDGFPRRRGFGTELLERTLAYELKAQTSLSYRDSGLHCRIELPLTDRVAVSPRAWGEAERPGAS